jgi:hypothetical protein
MPSTPGSPTGLVEVVNGGPGSQLAQLRATAQRGPPSSLELNFPAGPYLVLDHGHTLSAIVRDAQNNVLPDVQVTGTVEAGGGTVTSPVTTNENGIATLYWTTGTVEGSEQRLRVSVGGLSAVISREGHYVWVTPTSPAPGTVVTTPTLQARANASHYLAGFSCVTGTACVTVTYAGRTTELGRRPAQLGWVGTLDLTGLPAGPLDLVFRIDYQGHSDEETVPIVYQP